MQNLLVQIIDRRNGKVIAENINAKLAVQQAWRKIESGEIWPEYRNLNDCDRVYPDGMKVPCEK